MDERCISAIAKSKLTSLVVMLRALSHLSDGKASVAEFCDALTRCYDPSEFMLYDGYGVGLAEPIIDKMNGMFKTGFDARGDAVYELFNSHFWDNADVTMRLAGQVMPVDRIMIANEDVHTMSSFLWRRIFSENLPFDALQNVIDSQHIQNPVENSLRREQPTQAASSRWPWGNHHTELLGHLEAAALRYWQNYDPTDATTAPTNRDVAEWLVNERKVSQKMSESIASMLRLDGLPTGPRK